MSTDRGQPSQGIQPELPLPPPSAEAAARRRGNQTRKVRNGTDKGEPGGAAHGRRLDERTRRIGRQGVAAARAQLNEALSATDGKRDEGGNRRPGRAA